MAFVNRKKKGNKRTTGAEKAAELTAWDMDRPAAGPVRAEVGAHLNWMGGPSFFLSDPIRTLRLAASSSFFGEPMYYHTDTADTRPKRGARSRGGASRLSEDDLTRLRTTLGAVEQREWRNLSPAALMERAIDAALAHDPVATLAEAVRLRQEEHVRTTPQVILVRAANAKNVKGTGLITKYAPQIIARADEPSAGLAYQLSAFGKPIPNSLKKAWAARLASFEEGQLAKYRGTAREVGVADVISLTHAKSAAVNALMRDELRTTGETWEAIISAKGSTREAWEEALGHMGHMALLRNLRNFLLKGVPVEAFADKLVAGVKGGKQLPFRYYSAYLAVSGLAKPHLDRRSNKTDPSVVSEAVLAPVVNALERCLRESLTNAPYFGGRVMSLCDNSGSAWGTTTSSMGRMHIAQIANLTGVITGLRCREGYVGVFGDRLEVFPVVKKEAGASVFATVEALDKAGKDIGQGTENGVWLFWDQAIREKQHWDHVFVYSDMQAGHGGLYGTDSKAYADFIWGSMGNFRGGMAYIDVPRLIRAYREQVNPKVMVYLVQVAGYQDTIVPEFYDRTFILGGWGEGLLRFAAQMSELYHTAGQQ